tara:strand:- start:478 stop:1275 length:798 start_codon:yes stop_codon:yes gene_type:complete
VALNLIDKILENYIKENIPDKEVAVLLSGGVDSLSVAFALHRQGKKIISYSFKLKNIPNYDFEKAKTVSKIFNWDFKEIIIDPKLLKDDFYKLKDLGCYKKTHYECMYPFIYIFPQIKEKYVASGWAADGYYGISKKAMIHFRKPKELFDKFRNDYFLPKNSAGFFFLDKIAKLNNKIVIAPYLSKEVKQFFYEKDWFELNKPYQKHHVRKSFIEFKKIGEVKKHINLQIGSKITKIFETLINDNIINFKNRKRVMDICRDWANK